MLIKLHFNIMQFPGEGLECEMKRFRTCLADGMPLLMPPVSRVGLSRNQTAKAAEPIAMPFRMLTRVGPRNHVLDGVQIPTCEGAIVRAKKAQAQDMP